MKINSDFLEAKVEHIADGTTTKLSDSTETTFELSRPYTDYDIIIIEWSAFQYSTVITMPIPTYRILPVVHFYPNVIQTNEIYASAYIYFPDATHAVCKVDGHGTWGAGNMRFRGIDGIKLK